MPITKDEVLLNSLYIDVTWEQLNLAKTTLNLIPGQVYRITDRYNYQSGGSGLIPNQSFLGDDRGIVYIRALTNSELNKEVVRIMACPSIYAIESGWRGVWNINSAGIAGINYVWGGKVWLNITGNIGTSIDDVTLDSEFQLIDKSAGLLTTEYTDKQFSCLYDFDNDWFEEQKDSNNNVVGIAFNNTGLYGISSSNPCDITDWNFKGNRLGALFLNNQAKLGICNNVSTYIYNNSVEYYIKSNKVPSILGNMVFAIYGNKTTISIEYNRNGSIFDNVNIGSISDNVVLGPYQINNNHCGNIKNNVVKGHIYYNFNTSDIAFNNCEGNIINNQLNVGYINYNHCSVISANNNTGSISNNNINGSINSNVNLSDISSNIGIGSISNNANTGTISGNSMKSNISSLDSTCLHYYLDKLSNTDMGGYYDWVIDITGLSAITLSFSSYLKDVLITSTNATETITDVLYMTDEQKIKFKPEPTLTSLTFVHNAAKIKCEGGIDAVLNGANGDFIELEKPADFTACRQINIGTY